MEVVVANGAVRGADLGRLHPGFRADLIVIDEDVTVHRVVRGETVIQVA